MPIFPELVDSNFNHLSLNDFIVTLDIAAEKQQYHEAFQGNLPEYVTKSDQLTELMGHIVKARTAAQGHDKFRVAELNHLWEMAKKSLALNAFHLNMLAYYRNDPSVVEGAGYNTKQKSSRSASVNVLDLVPEVYAKHQAPQGTIAVLVKRAKPTAIVELQMTYGDPGDESSWTDLGVHNNSRIEQRGLKVASKVHLRARYHQGGKNGAWSSITSIVVI